nr:hypothetical protein [Bradyrhizobium sp. 2S1]MCK7667595.1 hypothetical protein [Bradyrhizobium sp. 2S1]
MAQSFTYQVSPMRVVFGVGTVAALADELGRLSISRALVLASRGSSELGDLAVLTGGRVAGVFDGAVVHTPVAVTDQANAGGARCEADAWSRSRRRRDRLEQGDCAAHRPAATDPADQLCGSEMTPVLGETVDGVKTTHRRRRYCEA